MEKMKKLAADPAAAQREFRNLVADASMLFVVLGEGNEAEDLVGLASQYAGSPMDPRIVVWAPKPEHIRSVVQKTLPGPQPNLGGAGHDRGFTVSLTNRIKDVIAADEPPPDDVRVVQAWTNAMKGY